MKTETTTAVTADHDTARATQAGPRLATSALLVLATLLGALCYPLITVGLELVPPFQFAAIRATLAALGLLLVARLLGRPSRAVAAFGWASRWLAAARLRWASTGCSSRAVWCRLALPPSSPTPNR